jgi:hypothetical protein
MGEDAVELHFRVREPGGDWRSITQTVLLDLQPCHFGGSRPWFICPGASCGRRVGVLYGAGVYFLCRHCYRLAYESQREDVWNRMIRRERGIRERLGGSASLLEPFPWKPKGMHWRTYERMRMLANAAALEGFTHGMAWMDRLERLTERNVAPKSKR